jgi:hypothetical protein
MVKFKIAGSHVCAVWRDGRRGITKIDPSMGCDHGPLRQDTRRWRNGLLHDEFYRHYTVTPVTIKPFH